MGKYLVSLIFLFVGFLSVNAAGPSGTLPVVYINIEGGKEVSSKDYYLNASYWLDPKGQSDIDKFGSQDKPLAMKIKGRGNYTFTGFDKKPYRLKLDKKAALCGMKASKHFALLAHADDNRAFLRNTIGFKVSEIVGLPWTPKQCPVELVINGTYRGLYFLTELIRIDTDRVNITKWQEEDESGAKLSKWIEGGTLVELDNYNEQAQIRFNNPGVSEPLRFTYDKSVDPGYEPDGYVSWLKSSLGKVNDIILNGDRESDELWDYVDIDDLAKFITVQEFMDNYESFHGSCYMFREKGENEKWHFSPVWDFGSAFQRSHPNHSFYERNDGNPHYNHWVGELLEYPALKEKIAEYWSILKERRIEIDNYASEFISQISSAAASDKQRWPNYGNDNLSSKLNEVKSFMNAATSYMNRAYNTGSDPVVEKDFYISGQFNDWALSDFNYKMTYTDGHYEFDCPLGLNGKWKINDGTWNVNFGTDNQNTQPMLNQLYKLGQNGGNISTAVPVGGRIIFSYRPQDVSTLLIKESADSGIEDVSMGEGYTITAANGAVIVDANRSFVLTISDLTGRVYKHQIVPGVTVINLNRGIYIIDKRKIAL